MSERVSRSPVASDVSGSGTRPVLSHVGVVGLALGLVAFATDLLTGLPAAVGFRGCPGFR